MQASRVGFLHTGSNIIVYRRSLALSVGSRQISYHCIVASAFSGHNLQANFSFFR